jgi:adenosylcobinamide-phosphate synthase
VRSLGDQLLAVAKALESGDLAKARLKAAGLLPQDDSLWSEALVVRACVEKAAQDVVTGAINPVLFAMLGGAPLALAAYVLGVVAKTLEAGSVGSERPGAWPARLHYLVEAPGALLSLPLISLAAWIYGYSFLDALETALQDAWHHPGFLSACPVAAFAGALGVQLGQHDPDDLTEKGLLGVARQALDARALRGAVVLLYAASFLSVLLALLVWVLLK